MLSIGDFAKMTHLSIRTLRHYHEVGLLEPADIDPSTGYRHYALDQVPTAQVIRRFRDLEMPVDRVREVLAAPDLATRNRLIADHLGTLEARLAQTQAAVASLKRLLEPAASIAVELRAVPELRVLAITAVVDRADLLAWWRGAIGELEATVEAQRLPRIGATGGTFDSRVFELDRGECTIFVPIAGGPRPIGRTTERVIPATDLAITVHHGHIDTVDVTYGALGTYVATHALAGFGPLRESYLVDMRTHPEHEWRTEIGWPALVSA